MVLFILTIGLPSVNTVFLYFIHRTTPSPGTPYIHIDGPMNNVTANVGDTVTLSCRIRGYPTPHYWWYRNDAYIQGNIGRMSVKNFTWGSRLRIRNVDTLDMGAFKCISENSAGSKTVIGKISLNPGKSFMSRVCWLVLVILVHLLLCFICFFYSFATLFL